jgi:hypothetical protein
MRTSTPLILALTLLAGTAPAIAGGGWVPRPGDGWVQLGASRKTAQSSWNARGGTIQNQQDHDFRYAYLSGEAGIWKGLAASWTITYLNGLEGRPDDLEENNGLSDAWFGLEYGFRQDTQIPIAVGFTVRTPIFYDQEGAYNRHTFNSDGSFRGVSSEWRGLLKHDYTLSVAASRSLWEGRGWTAVETGYTWREGAPSDEVPLAAELGLPLPWWGLRLKSTALYVQSVGNNTARRPNDRFGSSNPNFNFNDASMGRLGASLMLPVDTGERWWLEAGYNKWVWGRSARQYNEPFVSFGRSF